MTNEERDLITRFITRVGGNPAQGGFIGGSVPSTQPQLPPIDREADGLIADLLGRYPEARYRLTQLAVVQEQALGQAQSRINQLQAELQQARQAPQQSQGGASPWGNAQPQQQPQQPPPSRGLFGGLFGGGAQPQPQPQYQQPQYAPQQQYAPQGGGMFQRGGSGFLGSALTTAAGVAGGMVAGNALMNMFSGHRDSSTFGGGFGGEGGGFGQPGYGDQGGFAGGGGVDQYDVGGAAKDAPMQDDKFAGGGGYTDNSGWSTPDQGSSDPGWTDNSGGGGDGGGWTDNSGGSDSI